MIRLRVTALAVLAVLAAALAAAASPAAAQTEAPITQIAKGGFGNPIQQYSWSMAWFKGKLYVGTAANELCVENATLDYYYPNLGLYGPNPAPDLHCTASEDDLDLRAEIWQFTPQTKTWKRVYRSPADIPNPHDPSKMVARDIGFRGMVVYGDQLYVGGVTADEYLPQLADAHPPRILRTSDGTSFTALDGAPRTLNTYLGAQKPIGYRSMVVYDNKLYVTASSGLTGDGVILEVKGADGDHPTFTQVSPSSMQVFELQDFNGQLYVGTGNADNGYGVYRTSFATNPATFAPIVTGGAGRGKTVTSVVSMQPYDGRLYVGASGWGNGSIFPVSELISIGTGDDWDVVVGAARDGKSPVSGLPDGFGNPFNAHFWRMEDAGGALLLGTNDWTWSLRNIPLLGDWLKPFMGYDLYGTCDGRTWWPATWNAFGDGVYNFGARTLLNTPAGTFLGSANHAQGTAVWRGPASGICPTSAATTTRVSARAAGGAHVAAHPASAPVARAQRLLADVQRCGTVLSWDRVRGASGYRVVRTENVRVHGVRVPRRIGRRQAAVPEAPPPMTRHRPGRAATFSMPGAPTTIGRTDSTFFVDRTAAGDRRATYTVVPEGVGGRDSMPSNLAVTPALEPQATFRRLRGLIDALDGRGAGAAAANARDRLGALASRALDRWQGGDRQGAVRELQQLRRAQRAVAHASRAGRAQAAQDLDDAALRLERRLRYAGVSCTP